MTNVTSRFRPVPALSGRLFKQKRGRNLIAVLAIFLTAMMFTALCTLTGSMAENLTQMAFRQTGSDAEASIRGLTEEEADLIASHPDVEAVGKSIVLGILENSDLRGRQVELRWADKTYASHAFSFPTTGRMPETADEIALDTLTLDRLGIPHTLGAEVEIQWQKDPADPALTVSRLTLCGYWEGNLSSYSSMAWVGREYADEMTGGVLSQDESDTLGLLMAQVILPESRDIEGEMDRILSDLGLALPYSVNLAYSPEMGAMAAQESLPMAVGMVLVFIAGCLIIYNIFQISVASDIRLYGQLKTVGMTGKQLRRLIYGEALILCAASIPLGLLAGWGLGALLVPVLLGMAEGEMSVSVSPLIFIGAALLSAATVFASCLRPARLAGKVSPIEAMRTADAVVPGARARRRPLRQDGSLLSMAARNLGRNKKRTATVVGSLTLALVLLGVFYAQNAAFDIEKYLSDLTIADFTLSDPSNTDYAGGYDPEGDALTEGLAAEAGSLPYLEAVGRQYTAETDWQMDENTREKVAAFYDARRLAEWESYDAAGAEACRAAIQTGEAAAIVHGLSGIPLDTITGGEYLLEGAFDPEAFAGGGYILAVGPAVDPEAEYPVLPVPDVGSEVTLNGETFTVMAVVYPLNPVMELPREAGSDGKFPITFILPEEQFRALWPEYTMRQLFVNVGDEGLEEAESRFAGYADETGAALTSRRTMAEQYEAETRSSAVMGSAVSAVIALVGVLNFVNSMATSILTRKREFAVMQSIGMTGRQLRRMLACEGLLYAGLTLAASCLITIPAVGIGVRAMVSGGFTTFRFTLLPLAACTPVLLILAVAVPWLCLRNVEKRSVVERLRTE